MSSSRLVVSLSLSLYMEPEYQIFNNSRTTKHERSPYNQFTVAVMKDRLTVGHAPCQSCAVCFQGLSCALLQDDSRYRSPIKEDTVPSTLSRVSWTQSCWTICIPVHSCNCLVSIVLFNAKPMRGWALTWDSMVYMYMCTALLHMAWISCRVIMALRWGSYLPTHIELVKTHVVLVKIRHPCAKVE